MSQNKVELFVWKRPAFIKKSLFDHTMVTDYNPLVSPQPAQSLYWYCWGNLHDNADLLIRGIGDLQLAKCISTPNDPKDHAGIIGPYGLYGFCHQVTNRILFSTFSLPNGPLTVRGVRGYTLSYSLSGTYGGTSSEWNSRLRGCMGLPPLDLFSAEEGEGAMNELIPINWSQKKKDFVMEAHKRLLEEKSNLNEDVIEGRISGVEFANAVNELLQQYVNIITDKLGRVACRELFGHDADAPVALLDPEIAAKEDYTSKELQEHFMTEDTY